MEQEPKHSISVEIPATEGYFSQESQRLLQPKSDNRRGWQSLLEESYRNYLIAGLLVFLGLAVIGLSILIKYVVFQTSSQRTIANCIESYVSFDGWQFRQVCRQCQVNYLPYGSECVLFSS